MYQIDTATASATQPARPSAGTKKYFKNGNAATGDPATIVPDWWCNMVQNEIAAVLAAAGIVQNKTNDTQLLQAINTLIAGVSFSSGTLQAQAGNYAADSGAANAYACTLTPALVAHVVGMPIRVKIANTNTAASTFNPGPGVKAIKARDGSALQAGDLPAGAIAEFVYDGTNYQVKIYGASSTRAGIVELATSAETITGTDAVRAVTPAGFTAGLAAALAGLVLFTEVYESGQITVPSSGATSVSHGLSGRPRGYTALLVNTTAELNYAVGDCVPIAGAFTDSGSARGADVFLNASAIGVIVSSGGIRVTNMITNAVQAITEANWRLVFTAWR